MRKKQTKTREVRENTKVCNVNPFYLSNCSLRQICMVAEVTVRNIPKNKSDASYYIYLSKKDFHYTLYYFPTSFCFPHFSSLFMQEIFLLIFLFKFKYLFYIMLYFLHSFI